MKMPPVLRTVLVALALLSLSSDMYAQKVSPFAVGASTPLRRTLLNTVRPTVEKAMAQKVKFQVRRLNANAEWAFLDGIALQPNGKPVDLKQTPFKNVEPMDGPTVFALLRKKAGHWRIVTYSIGPTDVVWSGWDEEFGVPGALLGKTRNVPQKQK